MESERKRPELVDINEEIKPIISTIKTNRKNVVSCASRVIFVQKWSQGVFDKAVARYSAQSILNPFANSYNDRKNEYKNRVK